MAELSSKAEIIVINESLKESIIKDTYSALISIGIMSAGYIMDSTVLSVIGFVILCFLLVVSLANNFNKRGMSSKEALLKIVKIRMDRSTDEDEKAKLSKFYDQIA